MISMKFFIKNFLNTKMLIAFLLVALWSFLYVEDYITASEITNNNFNVLEPAIYLLSNKSVSAFLFVLCFVFSFCDVPFEDGILPYYVYRSGYKRWHNKLIAFTVAFCIIFILIPIITSVAFGAIKGFLSLNIWSSTAILTANGGAPKLSFVPEITLGIMEYSPAEVLLFSFVLTFLHYFFIAMTLLVINSMLKKTWGVLFVTALETIGFILSMTYPKISRIFPFVSGSFEENVFCVLEAVSGFLIICTLLIILSSFSIKKYEFESGEAK